MIYRQNTLHFQITKWIRNDEKVLIDLTDPYDS